MKAPHSNGPTGTDRTRDKLLEVGGRVFAERGYYAATVRDICAQAGSNVAAVNYHFGDKMGLYTQVLQRSVKASHLEALRNVFVQDLAPEEMLRAVIRARLEGVCRGDLANQQVRIMLHEMNQPTAAMKRLLQDVSRPIYERMLEVVGKIIGLPPAHETTRLCAHSIMGQIMLYALAGPLFGTVWPEFKITPERISHIADHIADFSLAYLGSVGARNRRNGKARHARRPR